MIYRLLMSVNIAIPLVGIGGALATGNDWGWQFSAAVGWTMAAIWREQSEAGR